MKTSPLTLAVTAGLLAVTGVAVQAVHADDRSTSSIEIVALDRHSSSMKALVRDSDGDGWTDWVERLEGTDPDDPSSHPQQVRTELLDGSLYVQSSAFPDRFVVIDLATLPLDVPIEQGGIESLADVIGQLTGQTSLGKFVAEMQSSEFVHGQSELLDGILADASKLMGHDDGEIAARTGGTVVSLIAGGMPGMQGAKDNDFVQVEMKGGDVKVTVTTTELDPSGTGNAYVKEYVNGNLKSSSIISYKNGVAVFGTQTDASGKQTDAAVIPLSSAPTATSTPAPSTASTAPASTAPASNSTNSSTATTAPASSAPATTEQGDYTNPDADQDKVVVTEADVRARVAFIRGVNTNYRSAIALPKDWSPTKSGVADPAEPDCDQSGCVAFTVFATNPIDTSTAGACPTTYCTPGRP